MSSRLGGHLGVRRRGRCFKVTLTATSRRRTWVEESGDGLRENDARLRPLADQALHARMRAITVGNEEPRFPPGLWWGGSQARRRVGIAMTTPPPGAASAFHARCAAVRNGGRFAGPRRPPPARVEASSSLVGCAARIRSGRSARPVSRSPRTFGQSGPTCRSRPARSTAATSSTRTFRAGSSPATEQVTTLEGEIDGRVTERVRWTLDFTRLAR